VQSSKSDSIGAARVAAVLGLVTALGLERGARAQEAELPTAGTRRMAKLLEERGRAVEPGKVAFLSEQRVPLARAQLATATNPGQARRFRYALAHELLSAGHTEEAIAELEAIRAELLDKKPATAAALLPEVRSDLAIAWLRLGEQENCLARHGPDSCLMPIRGGGVHQVTRGAEHALEELHAALRERPDDLGARWLLNVAAMALGQWPDHVAKEWLVPPAAFESEAPFPRFFDVAPRLGLDVVALSGGVVADDLDGDGFVDLICSSLGLRDQLRAFRSNGDGTFTERTKEAGLEGEVGGLNLIHFDYDNDGFADLFVLRGAWFRGEGRLPNSLLRNRGDFTFDDVTERAGVLTFAPTQTAVAADFDGDGWLDLFVGNESGSDGAFPCELWWNRRDGTFRDVAAEAGVAATLFVKGVAAGDFDNDGRTDLYVSVMGGPNGLLRNEPAAAASGHPPFRFVDATARAGVAEPTFSFPTWFFDYDNDGFEDLLVAGYSGLRERSVDDVARLHLGLATTADRPRLYRNRGDGTFEDVTVKLGLDRALLVMGANFGDLDNDGWLDACFGTGDPDLRTLLPNKMFRNDAGRRFQDVTTAAGFGHLQKGHGVAFADFDNDGDQDLYVVLGGAVSGDVYQNALFENPGFGRRWLTIELSGTRSNRFGVGTRVAVTVATPAGERTIRVTGGTGGSFGSSTLAQEIGLGDATAIQKVEVRWPASGIRQTFTGVALDQRIRIAEGSDEVTPVPMQRIDLSPDR